jgi:hypothetical protein
VAFEGHMAKESKPQNNSGQESNPLFKIIEVFLEMSPRFPSCCKVTLICRLKNTEETVPIGQTIGRSLGLEREKKLSVVEGVYYAGAFGL